MRNIMAAVLALALLAGIAGTGYANDFPRDFWDEQERNLP
jgi:hypothetical protein